MNKCSIWKSDSKNEQSEMKDTGDDVKHQIKRTANLRGQEVVINMHKYSFGGAKVILPYLSDYYYKVKSCHNIFSACIDSETHGSAVFF